MAVVVSANETFEGWLVVAAVDNNDVLQTRTKIVEISSAITTAAAAEAAVAAAAAALDAINEADVIEYGIRIKFPHDGTAVTVIGNVRKEAVLSLRPAAGGDLMTHTIYSPSDALVAGNNVVTTLAALGTYLDQFETAGALRMSDGEALAAANQIATARIRHVTGPRST